MAMNNRKANGACLNNLDQVGRRMLVDDLLKFNTPDAFLKAALCLQCASGMPEVRQAGNWGIADLPMKCRKAILRYAMWASALSFRAIGESPPSAEGGGQDRSYRNSTQNHRHLFRISTPTGPIQIEAKSCPRPLPARSPFRAKTYSRHNAHLHRVTPWPIHACKRPHHAWLAAASGSCNTPTASLRRTPPEVRG